MAIYLDGLEDCCTHQATDNAGHCEFKCEANADNARAPLDFSFLVSSAEFGTAALIFHFAFCTIR